MAPDIVDQYVLDLDSPAAAAVGIPSILPRTTEDPQGDPGAAVLKAHAQVILGRMRCIRGNTTATVHRSVQQAAWRSRVSCPR